MLFLSRQAEKSIIPTEELTLLRQLMILGNKKGPGVKWASGKTSRKVRDGPATDSCNSPALPLLQIYFFWPGCPARVQLPLHPALGPSAPPLASQLYSCAQHCQAAFLRLSLTLLPLAMQHLMNPHEDRLSAPQNYTTTRGHNLGGSLLACVSQAFLSWSADAAFTHAGSGSLTCLEVVATVFITLFNTHCCPDAGRRFLPTNPLPGKDFQVFRVQCLHHVLFTEGSRIMFGKTRNTKTEINLNYFMAKYSTVRPIFQWTATSREPFILQISWFPVSLPSNCVLTLTMRLWIRWLTPL